MYVTFDRSKTLDELDPPAWREPDFDSYLVTTCHQLRRKRLEDFTVEDLRMMVGQEIGLYWLIPLALKLLAQNPLAQGDFYPGDLLVNVLRAPTQLWAERPAWRQSLEEVLAQLRESPREVTDALNSFRAATA